MGSADSLDALIRAQHWSKARQLCEERLSTDSSDPAATFYAGFTRHMMGEKEAARDWYRKAARFPEVAGLAHYNLACLEATSGRSEAAVEELQRAKAAGYDDLLSIRGDSDLDSVRNDPRFPYFSGFERRRMEFTDGDFVDYLLLLPDQFDESRRCPLLIGMGPGSESIGAASTGMELFWGKPLTRRGWLVVCPAAPAGGWHSDHGGQVFAKFLDGITREFRVADDMFHIAGCSNGGYSAFRFAAKHPDRCRSLWLVPGSYSRGDRAAIPQLQEVSVRWFVGSADGPWFEAARRMNAELQSHGLDSVLQVFPGEGHVMQSLQGDGFARRLHQEFGPEDRPSEQ